MALQAEEAMVDGDGGYISDDSSFYGDEDLRASLTEKANNFDPSTYWPTHHLHLPTIAAIARTKTLTKPPKPRKSTKAFNPYEGQHSGRQLAEPVPDFLSRLPPSTTPTTEISDHWIRIANPFTPNRPTSEDWARFTETANEYLDAYNAARAKVEASMSGKAKGTITRKLTPMRKQLEIDIMATAQKTGCTTGKWLLFVGIEDVDFVWGKVARGTAEEELGVAAKVAAKGADGEGGKERLICVYTADFEDRRDVGRVLGGLKEKGLLRGGNGDERVIYYKCDALTHLGINAGNEYGIKASLFSSKEILGIKEET